MTDYGAFVEDEWLAWWRESNWRQLTPQIREFVIRNMRGRELDADTMQDVASWITIRCWALPYVPDRPLAFVNALTRNRTLDHFKSFRVRRRENGEANDLALGETVSNAPCALDEIIREEDLKLLRAAMHELPDAFRRPLVFFHFQGRSILETAQLLGTSEGAMKMRLVRARLALADVMTARPKPLPPPPPPVRLKVPRPSRKGVRLGRQQGHRKNAHPLLAVLAREPAARIQHALAQLHPNVAEVIRRHDMQREPVPVIAAAFNTTEQSIRQRLVRARTDLLAQLYLTQP